MLLILAVASCKSADSNSSSKEVEASNAPEIIEQDDVPDDELRDIGLIEKIEDGAYPFYVVTVDFPKREMKIDFNLNIESIDLDVQGLNDLLGKYTPITYTSELENNLIDLHLEGASLFGEYAPEYDSSWLKITGILKGADAVTAGDLPSMISIVDSDNKTMNFEIFIDPETVEANGKLVDAYYSVDIVNTLTQIDLVE